MKKVCALGNHDDMPPKKSAAKPQSASASTGALKKRIKELEERNVGLVAQRDELVKRIALIKVRVTAKMKELQSGIQRRIQADKNIPPESKSNILEYVKQGFFTAIGVIAAIAVVDLLVGALSDEPDEPPDEPDDEPDDDSGFGFDSLFEGGGGHKTTLTRSLPRTRRPTATKPCRRSKPCRRTKP